jgi:hypothetical protein
MMKESILFDEESSLFDWEIWMNILEMDKMESEAKQVPKDLLTQSNIH